MALDQNHVNRILGAARARDVAKVEELWIDLQSTDSNLEELKFFLSVASEVASRGDKEKAAELLLLLRQDLKAAEKTDELFQVLRQAVDYSARVKGVRADLVEAYKTKYADRPGLDALISRTDLAGEGRVDEAVRQLDEAFYFSEGDFVFHARGWGVGKVVECSPESGELVVDFARRRGQRMEAGMALKALEKRPDNDLDVLLWTDADRVRSMAKDEPLELLRAALRSSGGKLQSRILREKLTDVLEKSGWTKFWNKARKQAKDDPRIEVGSGPRASISLRDTPLEREDEIAMRLKQLRAFKDRLGIARSELVSLRKDSGNEEPPSWLPKALEQLTRGHGKTNLAKAAAQVELALFKNEVVDVWPEAIPGISSKGEDGGIDPETGEQLPAKVPAHLDEALGDKIGPKLPPVLSEMSIPEYRKQVVRLVAQIAPQEAAENLEAVLLDPAAQTWPVAAEELKRLGREDVILSAVNKVLITPEDYPEALAAFARARLTGAIEIVPERRDSEILTKTISVFDTVNLEFKGTTDRKLKKKLKTTVEALRTLISEKNQRVIKNVVENGTEDEVRRVLQLVRQSPTLTPTIKRACEKYVAKRFPELLATVATTQREVEVDDTLYSTVEGVKKRELEMNEILNVKMPEITIEIGKALEFGDISENAELDAARERQQRLAEQVQRIQDELKRVRLIDPAAIETDEVRVGTRVVVQNLDSDSEEQYSLLGPWDLDDEDGSIISYMSALATGLIGAKPGDERTIDLPGGKTARYQVKAIEAALAVESET